ncbi:M20 family metallopeptidase [Crateriforma spongiae]|uniref:M20 family metallopeptidase n=1 Tax=Crateriforma spongiae TaxID=2724528 RepID=UPI001446C3F3|nr:M20 family metallopeptidase [Crateriforma spongiae]
MTPPPVQPARSAAVGQCCELLESLIRYPTISHTSNVDIHAHIADVLSELGFRVENSTYVDARGVTKSNLAAVRPPVPTATTDAAGTSDGSSRPVDSSFPIESGFAYFCHTDVVPADGWDGPGGDPFAPVITDGRMFGRGTCDMKGSLAVMIQTLRGIAADEQRAPIWVVCTADEEVGFQGAQHLVQHSGAYREMVEAQPLAVIGEPTGLAVYHAHKGITGFTLTSQGRAGHSSTRDGINANIAMVPLLDKLLEIYHRTESDPQYQNDQFDPPTLSWNFGVSDSMNVVNITPPRCKAWCSLRPMPGIDGEDLIDEVRTLAEAQGIQFTRHPGCPPFWCEADQPHIRQLASITGTQPATVCYGTDGGVLTELRSRVVLGPGDIAQAHTSDESISLRQIADGIERFDQIVRHWACGR